MTTRNLTRNNRGISPAFSTIILTAGVIVMILVAMTFASNILNTKVAENEFSTNQQFMQTAGEQIDDIAWTIGRTQTVSYSGRYGDVHFEDAALTYNVSVHTSQGWQDIDLGGQTGILLYNMPVSKYSLGNDYFQRIPPSADSSFLLSGSSAPVTQVLCEEKLPMPDGAYARIVLVPTMRVLTTTIGATTYYKFYLPTIENGANPYHRETVTLAGNGIDKVSRSGVDQISITVSYPKESTGFDSSFFSFTNNTITLNSASTPQIAPNSVVEFYVGNVQLTIGQS